MPGPNLETGLIEPGDGSYYCRCTSRNGSHPVCYEVNKDFRMRSVKFNPTGGIARSGLDPHPVPLDRHPTGGLDNVLG